MTRLVVVFPSFPNQRLSVFCACFRRHDQGPSKCRLSAGRNLLTRVIGPLLFSVLLDNSDAIAVVRKAVALRTPHSVRCGIIRRMRAWAEYSSV